MPFGKYKGEKLGDVDDSYLKWLRDECNADQIARYADRILLGAN